MRSLARALSSSRRPPPKAASKPCSAIASSSVTDCSRLRLARGPVSSTTRPLSMLSCTLATTRRTPHLAHELVAVVDHLGEVVAGVHVHHRERQPGRREREHGEVQQHRAVLATAEQQHRVLALGGDLADDRDRLVGERVEVRSRRSGIGDWVGVVLIRAVRIRSSRCRPSDRRGGPRRARPGGCTASSRCDG